MDRFDNRTVGIPSFTDANQLFLSEDEAFNFLNARGVFNHNLGVCQKCQIGNMSDFRRADVKFQVRCDNRACRNSCSKLRGTFFTNTKLPLNTVLFAGYLRLLKLNWTQIALLTGLSENTVSNYIGFYRQLVSSDLKVQDKLIGGPYLNESVLEHVWRRKNHNNLWEQFILAIVNIRY